MKSKRSKKSLITVKMSVDRNHFQIDSVLFLLDMCFITLDLSVTIDPFVEWEFNQSFNSQHHGSLTFGGVIVFTFPLLARSARRNSSNTYFIERTIHHLALGTLPLFEFDIVDSIVGFITIFATIIGMPKFTAHLSWSILMVVVVGVGVEMLQWDLK